MPTKRKKKSTEHIIINTMTGKINCLHCGKVEPFNELLPAPINAAAKLSEFYSLKHVNCRETDDGRALKAAFEKMGKEWDEKHGEKKGVTIVLG